MCVCVCVCVCVYLQAYKCERRMVCVCVCVCVYLHACKRERRMGESALAVKFFALPYVYIHCSGNARMGMALLFTDLLEFL